MKYFIFLFLFSIIGCGISKDEHQKVLDELSKTKKELDDAKATLRKPKVVAVKLENGIFSNYTFCWLNKAVFSVQEFGLFDTNVKTVSISFMNQNNVVVKKQNYNTSKNINNVSMIELDLPDGLKEEEIYTLVVKKVN